MRNYFLKLLCFLRKHKHCQDGKIDQFLAINQLQIQITESFKSLSPQLYGATYQEVSTKSLETGQKCPLYHKIGTYFKLIYYEEELLPKMGGRAGPIWSCPKKPPHPSF